MEENNIQNTKNELIKASQYFYSKGWMLGTSGNLSALLSNENLNFLITRSGNDKGELTSSDFLLVDNAGNSLEKNNSIKPSAETLLHAAIYKLTNAKVIFHVHTVNVTFLSMTSKSNYLSFSGLEMLKGLGLKTHDCTVHIPILENSQDMNYLADLIPSCINIDVPGFILKGHGIYAWGDSFKDAKRHVEIFEFLFEYMAMLKSK